MWLHFLGSVPLLGYQVVTVCAVVHYVTLPVLGVRNRDTAKRRKEETSRDATGVGEGLLVLSWETRHGGPIQGGEGFAYWVAAEAFFFTRVSTRRRQNGQSTKSD